MRKVIRDTLTKNGFTDLHEAVDGKDAVEKYFELQPDLVLMDITMPNMDGLEALKAIRAKDNKANVVMCSAMGQEAMVVEAVQAGIKDFIVKPFKEDRLMKTVNSILGNPDGSGQCRKCFGPSVQFWASWCWLSVYPLCCRTGTGRRSKPPGKADAYNFGPGGGGKGSKAPPGPRGRNVLFPGGDSGEHHLSGKAHCRGGRGLDGRRRRRRRAKMGFQEALHSVLEQRKQQRRP